MVVREQKICITLCFMDLFPVSPGKFWFSLVQNQTYSLCFFPLFSQHWGAEDKKRNRADSNVLNSLLYDI